MEKKSHLDLHIYINTRRGTAFTSTQSHATYTTIRIPSVTMSFVPVNPRPMLQGLVNKEVIVRLKWNETEYKGKLVSIDSYMNLQLDDTVEYINRKDNGNLGQVLIR